MRRRLTFTAVLSIAVMAVMLVLASAVTQAQQAKPRQSGQRSSPPAAQQPPRRQPQQAQPPVAQRPPQRQQPQRTQPSNRGSGQQPQAVPRNDQGRGRGRQGVGSQGQQGRGPGDQMGRGMGRQGLGGEPGRTPPRRPPGIYSNERPLGPQMAPNRFYPRDMYRYAIPKGWPYPGSHPTFGPYRWGLFNSYDFYWRPFPEFWRYPYTCVPGRWEWDPDCYCWVWIEGFCNIRGHYHSLDGGFYFWFDFRR